MNTWNTQNAFIHFYNRLAYVYKEISIENPKNSIPYLII